MDFSTRHRLVILADMGNENDEEQQMAHMLINSNEFDLEALIAVTGTWLRPESKNPYRRVLHPELFHELIDAYEKVFPNLKLHAKGWPTPDYLRSIVHEGQKGYGTDDIGPGKSSPGSRAIIASLLKNDSRPLWVVVNAGSNTLAQALLDLEKKFSDRPLRFAELVAKLRVFENGAQDNAGAWICGKYPNIHWIRSNYQTYAYGGPRSDLGPHFWKPHAYSPEGQDEWLKEHVREGHGALGDRYPPRNNGNRVRFMEGGGTIPWLGLVNKGLFDINEPSWGGWGGRYTRQKVDAVWSRHKGIRSDEEKLPKFSVYRDTPDSWINPDTGETLRGDFVPVWRWRPAMYANLQCRMDWCVRPFEQANHHPVAVIDGDSSDKIVYRTAQPGAILSLDASASSDPDSDDLKYLWWQYKEAGTYTKDVPINHTSSSSVKVRIPDDAGGTQIHIIFELSDLNKIASLRDYRRVVIDVQNEFNK